MRRLWPLFLFVAAVLGFGITFFFVARSDVPGASGAFESTSAKGWQLVALTAGYGFLVTLFGVALGAIYRRLIKLRSEGIESVKLGSLFREAFTSVDFLIGIVGAPIVYGLLWQSLADISIAGLTIIALQNGFASHAILDQFVERGTQAAPRNSAT